MSYKTNKIEYNYTLIIGTKQAYIKNEINVQNSLTALTALPTIAMAIVIALLGT